jgi:hypothetical protein
VMLQVLSCVLFCINNRWKLMFQRSSSKTASTQKKRETHTDAKTKNKPSP